MGKVPQLVSVELIDPPEGLKLLWEDNQADKELLQSIRNMGIIEPLALAPSGERYTLICGKRRLIAARLIPLVEVPAMVFDVGLDDAAVLRLHENLFRTDPNPVELSRQLHHLEKTYLWTRRDIARKIGKSESWVTQRMDIMNYPPVLQSALEEGQLNTSQARELARIKDVTALTRILRQTIGSGASVRTILHWVKVELSAQAQKKKEEMPVTQSPKEEPPEKIEVPCFACGQTVSVQFTKGVRLCAGCHDALEGQGKET